MSIARPLSGTAGLGMAVALDLAAGASAQDMPPASGAGAALDERIAEWIAEWIAAHPDLILKSINDHMARQQANLTDFGAAAAQADLIVVEFSDFNCRFCREAEDTLRKGVETDKDLRILYRALGFLHPSSEAAALAARAADRQGRYRDYRAALFDAQTQSRFTDGDLKAVAEATGLDVAKWEADRKSDDLKAAMRADMDLAAKLKVGGTPFFFGWVRATRYALISQGAVNSETFAAMLHELRNGRSM